MFRVFVSGGVQLFSNKVLAEQECSEKKGKHINLLYVRLRF